MLPEPEKPDQQEFMVIKRKPSTGKAA